MAREKQLLMAQMKGRITMGAWLITCILGYAGLGTYLGERVEGMDASMVPLVPSILFVMALITSLVLTIWWARSTGGQPQDTGTAPAPGLGRRW